MLNWAGSRPDMLLEKQGCAPLSPTQPAKPETMKTGTQLIAEERQRQIAVEGWTPEHDDGHATRELAHAAKCYLRLYTNRAWVFTNELGFPSIGNDGPEKYRAEKAPDEWPWEFESWKPKDPLADLVKAGALIAAEIDRLQRKEAR